MNLISDINFKEVLQDGWWRKTKLVYHTYIIQIS